MGAAEHEPMRTRRAVAAGLTAGALFGPSLVRAQPAAPSATPMAPPVDPLLDPSVVAASADFSDRMTVPVKLNGQGPFPFVIDTGSNRSVVSEILAQRLNLPTGETLQVHAATGVVDTPSVRIANLTVGNRWLRNFDAPVLQAANLGALGMLGIDAVANQRIVLDFRRRRMSLIPAHQSNDDAGAVVVRARSKYGQLLLVDSSVEGIPLYVIIDTGGEMTIANSTLRTLLAKRRASYPQPVKITSVTGVTVDADLSFLPKVRLGAMDMSNLQVAYSDMYVFRQFGLDTKPAMLLGMSTLRYFDRVSIDFPAREVRFLLGPV